MRADIARYYPGRSLNEFHANEWGEGTMSWLELLEFVEALPDDSATKAAMAGDRDGRRWPEQNYLLATLVNLVMLLIRVQWVAGRLKGDPPDMKSVEGPGLSSGSSAVDSRRAELLREMARYRTRKDTDQPLDLSGLDALLKARAGP